MAGVCKSGIDTDLHGIRVDAYIEELPEEGEMRATVYDIEAENRPANRTTLPRRNRFYSGIIDTQFLTSGTDYRNMKDLVILTILSYDPFGAGETQGRTDDIERVITDASYLDTLMAAEKQ